MIIVILFQISISYYPVLGYRNIYLSPFILLLLFCINIHFSTKRYNDAVVVIEEGDNFLIYYSPVLNSILFLIHFILLGGFWRMHEPQILYLILLILANIIPITILCFKESDIKIKNGDIPINYINFLSELYLDKIVNIININDDYIYINNFEYSVKHYQNRHIITAYRNIDNEVLLTKYFKEKGINRLSFHYKYVYFELTDEEYFNMIADIKTFENVIYIDHPFMVINNVNIFIRNNGIKYSVVLLKSDREKLNNETDKLKNISKEKENEEYVGYEKIKKKDIISWIKNFV